MESDPEYIRKRYLYREMILKGYLKIPIKAAARFIGPDTAYHLYRFRKVRRSR
ncbi:MAG: hypothetical protein GXO97_06200 [Nitrospirae bacterium]|nr:hypothetical protein [Nitrospirota bacterium]